MTGTIEIVVRLDPQVEEFVRAEARKGSFASASEYVEALLREQFESEDALRRLESELDQGLADLDAGRVVPMDEAFDGIHAELSLKRRRG